MYKVTALCNYMLSAAVYEQLQVGALCTNSWARPFIHYDLIIGSHVTWCQGGVSVTVSVTQKPRCMLNLEKTRPLHCLCVTQAFCCLFLLIFWMLTTHVFNVFFWFWFCFPLLQSLSWMTFDLWPSCIISRRGSSGSFLCRQAMGTFSIHAEEISTLSSRCLETMLTLFALLWLHRIDLACCWLRWSSMGVWPWPGMKQHQNVTGWLVTRQWYVCWFVWIRKKGEKKEG